MNVFRHYKGGLYLFLGRAVRESDGVPLAIYRDKQGRTWARPLSEFNETLPSGVRRFEPCGPVWRAAMRFTAQTIAWRNGGGR